MDRILRFAAAAALGLAFAAPSALADSHGGVTVGGWIEVIGGTTDNDKAGSVDGISRGLFSRIAVSYDDTLDNGLTVAGRAAYQLNQRGAGVNVSTASVMQSPRMDASTNYAPDVLYISVGGGFGTVTVGAAAPASCSILPRPIAFLNGVNGTHYTLFTGLDTINGTFSEFSYCGTPEQISYTTPTVGGFRAMLTYAPDNESNQGTSLKNARDAQASDNVEDRIDIAASWSTSMGGMNISLGAGYQQGGYQSPDYTESIRIKAPAIVGAGAAPAIVDQEIAITALDERDDMKSYALAGTVNFGAVTFGAKWYSTEEGKSDYLQHDGYTLAAKYDIGNLTLGATWSTAERGTASGDAINSHMITIVGGPNDGETLRTEFDYSQEDSALVIGASYSLGGGLTTWIEYMNLETDCTPTCYSKNPDGTVKEDLPESDDIILVGVTLGF